jgi:hypothetical protein
MPLPNADRAVVEIEKLRDYCLSPTHPRSRHKARVFASRLGLTAEDAERLREALVAAVQIIDAIPGDCDEYGQRYILDFGLEGPEGQAMVRSACMIRTGEDFPRLLNCYVL